MSVSPIQIALYDAISGASVVTDLCSNVFDFGQGVDDGSSIYPYIAIGDISAGEMDTDTTTGFDAAVRIHTYTNTGGALACRAIQDAIYSTLHRASLVVTGKNAITIQRETSDVMMASSGAFHGVCDYRGLFDND